MQIIAGFLSGQNQENNIVKSDLLLVHVVNDKVEALDMYVLGFGNPKEDETIGGSMDIRMLAGEEKNGQTKVTFKIPIASKDQYDFSHKIGQQFWLILAYSMEDDFGHHSRMRKHVLFTLTDDS